LVIGYAGAATPARAQALRCLNVRRQIVVVSLPAVELSDPASGQEKAVIDVEVDALAR
jgi:hypothetical protein